MLENITWSFYIIVIYGVLYLRIRDYYIVIREFRVIQPKEFGKGKIIEGNSIHHFDEYLAARAFYDLHNNYAAAPDYEDRQQINYLYAVPALTAKRAGAKMTKKVHHEAKLLVETPYSALSALKRHWDEERKARSELDNPL